MKDMETAHREDYAVKNQMRDLRLTLLDFRDSGPDRLWISTQVALDTLIDLLEKQEAHIVAVWD